MLPTGSVVSDPIMPKPRSLLYVQYTNPCGYPPLEHSSRILADDSWEVTFLGTGSFGTNQLRFPPHSNIKVQLVPFQLPGWKQKLHYVCYIVWCLWHCITRRPTAVYCSDVWSMPVGVLLWYLLRIPVVFHEHDTPSGTNFVLRRLMAARSRLAKLAKACVIPNEDRRQLFDDALKPKRSVCVWNCPAIDEVVSHSGALATQLTLWYHGSLSLSQYPTTVLQALALLPKTVVLKYAGYETVGHVGFIREFQALAGSLGLTDRVEFVGTPPTRPALYSLACTADIGLSLFARVFREPMAGASNKPFDYLACGLALIVPNTPEWTELYVNAGVARSADPESPESIAAAIQWFIDHPDETRAMRERGRQRILNEWNYETQFAPVKQLLESLVR